MVGCPSCGELNGSRARFCQGCGQPLAPADEPDARRLATLLFVDLAGSTSLGEGLDPEVLRDVMGRYFTVLRDVVRRHGGVVEKFIGDAVVAVFGVPLAHEDDALRAVRAGLDMQDAVAKLNHEFGRLSRRLQVRVGINTGEVVVGAGRAGGSFATGDAVNVAARLEQAAAPGEVIVGPLTWALVRDFVQADARPALTVKGKGAALSTWRVRGLRSEATNPTGRGTFIGRNQELNALLRAFDRVLVRPGPQIVTVVGEAGLGKTRLSQELAGRIASRALVLRGRCLAYGDQASLWPLREIVFAATGLAGSETPTATRQALEAALRGSGHVEDAVNALTTFVGAADRSHAPQGALTGWAVRILLEHLARKRPLLVLVDDIHWAGAPLSKTLATLLDQVRDAPLLVVASARPEFTGEAGPWWQELPRSQVLRLTPLAEQRVTELLDRLGAPRPLQPALARAAGGNPLFAEQLVGALTDQGALTAAGSGQAGTTLVVPPTIAALLAARLDLLPKPERAMLELAAVIGTVFYPDALTELADSPSTITSTLEDLCAKDLLQRATTDLPGWDAVAFKHVLIRDAAYAGMPKAARADVHEAVAGWFESRVRDIPIEEQVGTHLEAACRYRQDLLADTETVQRLADRAAARLQKASRRLQLFNVGAAVDLLRRGAALPCTPEQRLGLLLEMADPLWEMGHTDQALSALEEVEHSSLATLAARARALAATVTAYDFRPGHTGAAAETTVRQQLPILEEAADLLGQAEAHYLLALLSSLRGRYAESLDSAGAAADLAARAGDEAFLGRVLMFRGVPYQFGPMPAEEAIAALRRQADQAGHDVRQRNWAIGYTVPFLAMCGQLEESRRAARHMREVLTNTGEASGLAGLAGVCAVAEEQAGHPDAAERLYEEAAAAYADIGLKDGRATMLARHARMLARRGRLGRAETLLEQARLLAMPGDYETHAHIAQAEALLYARRGQSNAAWDGIQRCFATYAGMDLVNDIAEAHATAAMVAQLLGQVREERDHLLAAKDLFERKGNVVRARVMAQQLHH